MSGLRGFLFDPRGGGGGCFYLRFAQVTDGRSVHTVYGGCLYWPVGLGMAMHVVCYYWLL